MKKETKAFAKTFVRFDVNEYYDTEYYDTEFQNVCLGKGTTILAPNSPYKRWPREKTNDSILSQHRFSRCNPNHVSCAGYGFVCVVDDRITIKWYKNGGQAWYYLI